MGNEDPTSKATEASGKPDVPASRLQPTEYEETPILTPIEDTPVDVQIFEKPESTREPSGQQKQLQSAAPAHPSIIRAVGNIVFFFLLFLSGIWISSFLRGRIPTLPQSNDMTGTPIMTQQAETEYTPTPDPFAGWRMQTVTSGVTKEAIPGVSFLLPTDGATLECDAKCTSQGMYLPGGTRFTVAARGKNQILPFVRGGQLVDTTGKAFVMREATISGYLTHEYSGEFMGTTAGGFSFSKMRGVIIQLTEDFALELNHFTPVGADADFATDDALFDRVVSTVTYAGPLTPAPTL